MTQRHAEYKIYLFDKILNSRTQNVHGRGATNILIFNIVEEVLSELILYHNSTLHSIKKQEKTKDI